MMGVIKTISVHSMNSNWLWICCPLTLEAFYYSISIEHTQFYSVKLFPNFYVYVNAISFSYNIFFNINNIYLSMSFIFHFVFLFYKSVAFYFKRSNQISIKSFFFSLFLSSTISFSFFHYDNMYRRNLN